MNLHFFTPAMLSIVGHDDSNDMKLSHAKAWSAAAAAHSLRQDLEIWPGASRLERLRQYDDVQRKGFKWAVLVINKPISLLSVPGKTFGLVLL